MAVSYLVFYRGCAKNQKVFLQHYREIHVPILKRFPGIREVTLHTPSAWEDAHSVNPAGFALVVEMRFDSMESLQAALESEARSEARVDLGEFPPFAGDIWHQAMKSEEF